MTVYKTAAVFLAPVSNPVAGYAVVLVVGDSVVPLAAIGKALPIKNEIGSDRKTNEFLNLCTSSLISAKNAVWRDSHCRLTEVPTGGVDGAKRVGEGRVRR